MKTGRRSTRTETFSTPGIFCQQKYISIFSSKCQQDHFCRCFVCAQCFRPFEDGVFFEFEGRKYCQHDFQVRNLKKNKKLFHALDFENLKQKLFQVLFAPCCAKCSEFIIGRVLKVFTFPSIFQTIVRKQIYLSPCEGPGGKI